MHDLQVYDQGAQVWSCCEHLFSREQYMKMEHHMQTQAEFALLSSEAIGLVMP